MSKRQQMLNKLARITYIRVRLYNSGKHKSKRRTCLALANESVRLKMLTNAWNKFEY